MTSPQPPGQIITFYSYKGGTGRSMALANVAWILASNGKRVLAIDWDLEAPGLHRYFHPFLRDKNLTSCEGLMDYVVDYVSEALTPSSGELPDDWYVPYADIGQYAESLRWPLFPKPGTLDLVPAGRQVESYAPTVNLFNWQHFYEKLGGGAFFEAAREHMRAEYDYILIDSRTGVSDTSGICTIQMPETVVLCFTLNIQSIEGALAVAETIVKQREATGREVRILPVPTRVDRSEKDKVEVARLEAWRLFDQFLWQLTPQERADYWASVEVPYEPWYSFEEVLATFGDRGRTQSSLLAVMETITSYISRGAVTRLEQVTEAEREKVLAAYLRRQPAPSEPAIADAATRGELAMARLSSAQQESALAALVRMASFTAGREAVVTRPVERADLADVPDRVVQALQYAQVISVTRRPDGGEVLEVTTPEIFHEWTRTKRVIDADRPFLEYRQQVGEKAAEHARSPDRSLLLRGSRLEEARTRLAERPADFNRSERHYIAASLRHQRRVRFAVAAAVLVPLLMVLVTVQVMSTNAFRVGRIIAEAPLLAEDDSFEASTAVADWVRALAASGREPEAREVIAAARFPARKAIALAALSDELATRGQPAEAAASRNLATAATRAVTDSTDRTRVLIAVANIVGERERQTALGLLFEAQRLAADPSYSEVASGLRAGTILTDRHSSPTRVSSQRTRFDIVAELIASLQRFDVQQDLERKARETFQQLTSDLEEIDPQVRARWLLELATRLQPPLTEAAQRAAILAIAEMPANSMRVDELASTVSLLANRRQGTTCAVIVAELNSGPFTHVERTAGTVGVLSTLARSRLVSPDDPFWQDARRLIDQAPDGSRAQLLGLLAAARATNGDAEGAAIILAEAAKERGWALPPALITSAEAAYRLGQPERSAQLVGMAKTYADNVNDIAYQSEVYMQIAAAAARSGNIEAAADLTSRVRDSTAMENGLPELLEAIGDTAASSDDAAAMQQTRFALNLAKRVDSAMARDNALALLVAALLSGKKSEAAIEAAAPIDSNEQMFAAVSQIIGGAERRHFDSLDQLIASIGDPDLRTQALLARIRRARQLGMPVDAAAAEETAASISDSAARSAAYREIASLHIAAGNLRAAHDAARLCGDDRDRLTVLAGIVTRFGTK